MGTLSRWTRIGLGAAYVALLVLAFVALLVLQQAYNQAAHRALAIPTILLHALPLLATRFSQDLVYGGPGGGDFGALAYVGTVLVQWWPLPAVALVPRLWTSRRGRRTIQAYFVVLAALMVGAGVWLALDPSLLAG